MTDSPAEPPPDDGASDAPIAQPERTVTVMRAAAPKRPRSLIRRLVYAALWVVLALLVAFAIFFFWASGGDSDEREVAPGHVFDNPAGAAPPASVAELTVVAFNIAYGRGPDGDASGPWSEAHIRRHLAGIGQQIRDSGADLAFLQEVDFAAARSHAIDQGRVLLEASGLRFASCVVTWEKNYVPFPYWPPTKHYGAMKSGQCLLSRFPIVQSTRHRLPQPESYPWWRKRFYLNRAIDHARVEIAGQTWDVFNVHLEAFDADNRMDHAKRLAALVAALPETRRVIVAGDFNAPPPEASQKKGFVDEPETDFSADRTIDIVRGLALAEALPDPATFTFPADAPTRRLDYIFFGAALDKIEAKILGASPGPWSDHLPVLARFALR
jgi:endonuclease/exonuclease/phosphatase family metal-dependent hydrolase